MRHPVLLNFIITLALLICTPLYAANSTKPEDGQDIYYKALNSLERNDERAGIELLERSIRLKYLPARTAYIKRLELQLWKDQTAASNHISDLRKAEKQGDAEAAAFDGLLGYFHYAAADTEASDWANRLRTGAAGRSGFAKFWYAEYALKDYDEKLKFVKEAAKAGDGQAQFVLATVYGPYFPEQIDSNALVRAAADAGYLPALVKLGTCYQEECQKYAYEAFYNGTAEPLLYWINNPDKPKRHSWANYSAICQRQEIWLRHAQRSLKYPAKAIDEYLPMLRRCVLEYGYIPEEEDTRQAMRKSANGADYKDVFALSDFNEKEYPFTHAERLRNASLIARALNPNGPLKYQFSCADFLDDVEDDDLTIERARSISRRYNNCVTSYRQDTLEQPVEKLEPAWLLLTKPEQARVSDIYKSSQKAIERQMTSANGRIADFFNTARQNLKYAQEAARAQEEGRRRAERENREMWANIQRQGAETARQFQSMLRGSNPQLDSIRASQQAAQQIDMEVFQAAADAAAAEQKSASRTSTTSGNYSAGRTSSQSNSTRSTASGSSTGSSSARSSNPQLTLTRIPEIDNGPSAEQKAQQARDAEAARRAAEQAAAAEEARKRESEAREKSRIARFCSRPENQSDCSCVALRPPVPGAACSR